GRGEIAVGAATGRGVHQFEADFGGKRPCVPVERRAGVALLVGWTIQSADDLDADAFGVRSQVLDPGHEFFGVGEGANAEIDLGVGVLRNDVRPGAALDHTDIDGDAALGVVHGVQRLN